MAISGTDLLEVATIYKAYFLGLCKGISQQNMAKNMVLTYLDFRILKISHWLHDVNIFLVEDRNDHFETKDANAGLKNA